MQALAETQRMLMPGVSDPADGGLDTLDGLLEQGPTAAERSAAGLAGGSVVGSAAGLASDSAAEIGITAGSADSSAIGSTGSAAGGLAAGLAGGSVVDSAAGLASDSAAEVGIAARSAGGSAIGSTGSATGNASTGLAVAAAGISAVGSTGGSAVGGLAAGSALGRGSVAPLDLSVLNLAVGDEVVVAPGVGRQFLADVLDLGARPVFADVDAHHGCLTADSIEAVLTSRSRAVLVQHLLGAAAPIESIAALAERHGIRVVVDEPAVPDLARRRAAAVGLSQALGSLPGLALPDLDRHTLAAFPLIIDPQLLGVGNRAYAAALADAGVAVLTRVYQQPLYRLPWRRDRLPVYGPGHCPVAEDRIGRTLVLLDWIPADVEATAEAIGRVHTTFLRTEG